MVPAEIITFRSDKEGTSVAAAHVAPPSREIFHVLTALQSAEATDLYTLSTTAIVLVDKQPVAVV